MLAHALSTGTSAAEKTESKSDDAKREENDDEDDALPEDRFHSRDMVSQHIKDERERQRNEKIEKHREQEKKAKRKRAKSRGGCKQAISGNKSMQSSKAAMRPQASSIRC